MTYDIGGVSPGTDEGAMTIRSPSPTMASATGTSMAAFAGRSFWATTRAAITNMKVTLMTLSATSITISPMLVPFICPFICRTAMTQDAAASPSVAVSATAVAAVVALVLAVATFLFKTCFLPSFLNESLETVEGFVPPLGDVLEIGSRHFHLFQLELPDALATTAYIRDEPCRGEHVQVLCNRLSRDGRSGGQPGNRERTIGA